MFVNYFKHAFVASIGTVKNFTLAVQYKFLQVQRHGLGYAEIFGVLAHGYFHFLAHPKEMVNSVPAGKNDSRKTGNVNFLFAELTRGNRFQPYKWMENKLNAVFPGQVEIRRLIAVWPGLGYENAPLFLFNNTRRFFCPVVYHAVLLKRIKFNLFSVYLVEQFLIYNKQRHQFNRAKIDKKMQSTNL
jgi:hypothetical protein